MCSLPHPEFREGFDAFEIVGDEDIDMGVGKDIEQIDVRMDGISLAHTRKITMRAVYR